MDLRCGTEVPGWEGGVARKTKTCSLSDVVCGCHGLIFKTSIIGSVCSGDFVLLFVALLDEGILLAHVFVAVFLFILCTVLFGECYRGFGAERERWGGS